tara:strand:+ start:1870 stop:2103 length:234 start_codon:yes stop_codon:yes gene_type:complete
MNNFSEIVEFVILYLQIRNVHRWEWAGYKNFKVLISYITGIKDVDYLRRIFEKIYSLGFFEKRKIGSNTEYFFNFNN